MIDPRDALDIAVAAYGATLSVAVLGLVPVRPAPGPAAYAGVAAGTFLVVLAGARSAERLHRSVDGWTALAALAVPVGWFAWFVVAAVDGGVVRYPLGVGATGVVPAGIAVALAHEVRLRERTERATELCSFAARPSARSRRLLVGGYAGVLAVAMAVGGAVLAFGGDVEPVTTLVPVLGSGGAVFPALTNEREVRLTDEGVRVGRTVHDWDAFEGYAVTGDAVVLARSGWRPAYRFDRSDVDDVDAVRRTLGRRLRRR